MSAMSSGLSREVWDAAQRAARAMDLDLPELIRIYEIRRQNPGPITSRLEVQLRDPAPRQYEATHSAAELYRWITEPEREALELLAKVYDIPLSDVLRIVQARREYQGSRRPLVDVRIRGNFNHDALLAPNRSDSIGTFASSSIACMPPVTAASSNQGDSDWTDVVAPSSGSVGDSSSDYVDMMALDDPYMNSSQNSITLESHQPLRAGLKLEGNARSHKPNELSNGISDFKIPETSPTPIKTHELLQHSGNAEWSAQSYSDSMHDISAPLYKIQSRDAIANPIGFPAMVPEQLCLDRAPNGQLLTWTQHQLASDGPKSGNVAIMNYPTDHVNAVLPVQNRTGTVLPDGRRSLGTLRPLALDQEESRAREEVDAKDDRQRLNHGRALVQKRKNACIPCAIQHKACKAMPGENYCEHCKNKKNALTMHIPCNVQYNIHDIAFFRTTTDPNITRARLGDQDIVLNRVTRRLGTESRWVHLTQDFEGCTLHFRVRQFDNSNISRESLPDNEKNVYSHPFELADIDEARRTIQKYTLDNTLLYIRTKIKHADSITKGFFKAAWDLAYRGRSVFMTNVLRLWAAARMIEGGWRFEGPETLDLEPDMTGTVPIIKAEFIDYQVSCLLVDHHLLPLRQEVIKGYKTLAHENKRANWYTLLLASFVLEHTYGILFIQQRKHARWRGVWSRYVHMPLIQSLHLGSKILLTYFHFLCKGAQPFSLDWTTAHGQKKMRKIADLDDEQMRLLSDLVPQIRDKIPEFQKLVETDEYEQEHWFTGQLFLPKWKPPNTIEHHIPA